MNIVILYKCPSNLTTECSACEFSSYDIRAYTAHAPYPVSRNANTVKREDVSYSL